MEESADRHEPTIVEEQAQTQVPHDEGNDALAEPQAVGESLESEPSVEVRAVDFVDVVDVMASPDQELSAASEDQDAPETQPDGGPSLAPPLLRGPDASFPSRQSLQSDSEPAQVGPPNSPHVAGSLHDEPEEIESFIVNLDDGSPAEESVAAPAAESQSEHAKSAPANPEAVVEVAEAPAPTAPDVASLEPSWDDEPLSAPSHTESVEAQEGDPEPEHLAAQPATVAPVVTESEPAPVVVALEPAPEAQAAPVAAAPTTPAAAAAPTPPPAAPRTRGPAHVLAVANQKGGVGKTTTTVSLAAGLAEAGVAVLVVDLDPQGNATTGLGERSGPEDTTAYHVLLEEATVAEATISTMVDGLSLIPSSLDLAGAEIELVPAFSREGRLRKALATVKDQYDIILIDCPPSLGLITINAMVAADRALVPIQCEYYALEGLGQLMQTVELVAANLNSDLALGGIVMTMYDARTKLSQQVVDEVRRHFHDLVFETVIPRTVRLSEAPSFGQPITVFDPSSRGARAYRRLADEVARRYELIPEPEPGTSALDRLLGMAGLDTPGTTEVVADTTTWEPSADEVADADNGGWA